jgi:gamma-glutamylcyclotransferase (GGCT)/AIG2-like uncharacterized protein YtfP
VNKEISRDYIFLYGSLISKKSPKEVKRLISKYCSFIDHGYISGKLYFLGSYPGAVISENIEDRVYGRVYEVTNGEYFFRLLDEYEDYQKENLENSEFIRIKSKVFLLSSKEVLNCWLYYYNGEVKDKEEIISGDYLSYLEKINLKGDKL